MLQLGCISSVLVGTAPLLDQAGSKDIQRVHPELQVVYIGKCILHGRGVADVTGGGMGGETEEEKRGKMGKKKERKDKWKFESKKSIIYVRLKGQIEDEKSVTSKYRHIMEKDNIIL